MISKATPATATATATATNYTINGPWTFDHDGYVCAPDGLICEVLKQDTDRETEANGRLIASAPDLLAALERLVHPLADEADIAFARATIARALGAKRPTTAQ